MRKKIILLLFGLILLAPAFGSAASIGVSGVSTYTTSSQMMQGMFVTVNFDDGSKWMGSWANIDPSTSGVGVADHGWFIQNTAWSPTIDDTYDNLWSISATDSLRITSFTIDGMIADVMFDILPQNDPDGNPLPNTKGSQDGYLSPYLGGWSAVFDDEVYLIGDAPIGDVWGKTTFTYNDAAGFEGLFSFWMDTDKTLDSKVPEPATMILFGLGLLGFGVVGRKKIFKS